MSRNYGGTMVANLFARFGADTEPFEKSMRSSVTRMLFAAERFTQAGRIMSTAITAPMAAIGFAALKTALQFDESMMRIKTLVGVAGAEVESWRDKILEISVATGRTANELADAMFFITSNGIRGAAALDALKSSAQAAAVGLGETKDIAFAATSAMNAYGEGTLAAQEAVAVLVKTVREGNLEASSLPPVLGQVLPIAAAMKLEFNQVGASIAYMTRSGNSAKISALGLKSALISIEAPTKGAMRAAKDAGLSFEHLRDVVAGGETGLLDALRMMKDAADKNNISFKELLPNQKAYIAALQLVGENVEASIAVHKSLAETVGKDLTDAFEETTKGPAHKYKVAMATLNTALVTLGQNLYPVIDAFASFAKTLASAAKTFDEMPDMWKSLISGFAGFLMIIGPGLYAIGSLGRMLASFTGLSILFKVAWVRNVAAIMTGEQAAVTATKSLTVLGTTITNVLGSGAAAFFAGWHVGKFLDDLLNITENFNKGLGNFKKTYQEIGSVYEKDTVRMGQAATAAYDLATQIGATSLAQQLEIAVKMNNTQVTSQLIDMINKQANAYNKATIKVDGLTEAERVQAEQEKALALAKEQATREEEQRLENLREERDLMTSGDVQQALKDMAAEYKDMVDLGISRNRINEKFAAQMVELLGWAKEYNIELPKGVLDMAESMKQQGIPQWEEMEKLMERVSQHIDAQPGKVIAGMVKVGDSIATELKGGFHRGFAEGMDEFTAFDKQLQDGLNASIKGGFGKGFDGMRDELQKVVRETFADPVRVPVIPDEEIWLKFFYDLANGRYPAT